MLIRSRLAINNIDGKSTYIRNMGTEIIEPDTVNFYIDGTFVSCNGLTKIAPNSIGNCNLSSPCKAGSRLRVAGIGNSDEVICS